jgi:hypothetical protein
METLKGKQSFRKVGINRQKEKFKIEEETRKI